MLALLLCGPATAQEPIVRASLAGTDERWVGQRLPLVVELLVPGYFTGTPAFDLPDPAGMILIPPAGSPVVSSEEIGGVSYTVQRHQLSVFPRRAGGQTIPAMPVRFSYKRQPLDKDSIPAAGTTEPIAFTAKSPPGAEHLGSLISARDLKVVDSWKPEPGKAKAGDAFTRTITFTAPEVPAMAFPPFPSGRIDGIGIYPKDPQVLDRSERGTLTGERRDTVTYVCQRAGHFTIPATRLTWFDLDAKELRTIDLAARTLDVAPNPSLASGSARASRGVPWKAWAGAALALGIFTALALRVDRRRVSHAVKRAIDPFRPVHLPPLNPEVLRRTPP